MVKTSAKSNQFQLRLPDGMKDRIALSAGKSGRSMNAWIVEAIETALQGRGEVSTDILEEIRQTVRVISQNMEELKQPGPQRAWPSSKRKKSNS